MTTLTLEVLPSLSVLFQNKSVLCRVTKMTYSTFVLNTCHYLCRKKKTDPMISLKFCGLITFNVWDVVLELVVQKSSNRWCTRAISSLPQCLVQCLESMVQLALYMHIQIYSSHSFYASEMRKTKHSRNREVTQTKPV